MNTVQSEVSLLANYTALVVDDETLYKIFLEKYGSAYERNREKFEWTKKEYPDIIARMVREYKGQYSGHIRVSKAHNKIPLGIRSELAKLIAGINTSASFFSANYIALGTGTAIASDSDTILGAEYVRSQFTQRSVSDNIAYLDKFFSSNEVGNTNMTEVGTFCEGTASANTGNLLSRVLINESFSATETLTMNVSISFTSAT